MFVTERKVGDIPVRVIDGAFDPGIVAMIHRIAQELPLTRSEAANPEDAYALSLKHEFEIARMLANPALRLLHTRVLAEADAFFGEGRYRLFRCHLNDQTFGDPQFAHPDVKSGATALYYANAEWRVEWEGETLFYDTSGDPVAVVAPRPGRLALFPGHLIHRGGSPSRSCLTARYTIAFKFERNPDWQG